MIDPLQPPPAVRVLFAGGPWDGRVEPVPARHLGWEIMALDPPEPNDLWLDSVPSALTRYMTRQLCISDVTLWVATPSGLSDREAAHLAGAAIVAKLGLGPVT